MNSDFIDNTLVEMKNEVLNRINGNDRNVEVLREIINNMKFVLPLWVALSYGYKGREILERIKLCLIDTKEALPGHHNAHVKSQAIQSLIETCVTLIKQLNESA